MKSREERRELFEQREAIRKETLRVRQEALAVRKADLKAKAKASSPITQMNAAVKNAREWSAYAAQQKKLAAGKTIPEDELLPKPEMIAQSTDICGASAGFKLRPMTTSVFTAPNVGLRPGWWLCLHR